MEKETFKQIPEFENYSISNSGIIKSYLGKKERILNPFIDSDGYHRIFLRKNKIRYQFKIHQLVAIVFLDHKPNKMKYVIDHINSNKTDNRVENLRIVSNRENCSKLTEKKNKTSNYIGISFCKDRNKWYASIRINGKLKNIGRFNTELEAHQAYQEALKNVQ